MKVAWIGLGRLGGPVATILARHHEVRGFDIRDELPDLEKVIIAPTLLDAIAGAQFIFVCVPTPHSARYGGDRPTAHLEPQDFDYTAVCSVMSQLRDAAPQQGIVLVSTVLPGTIRRLIVPLLHPEQKQKLIYNPYLVAMGSIREDMASPEMLIFGTENGDWCSGAVSALQDLYAPICGRARAVLGTWEEAECIKVFYNTFISAKLALVNTMMDVAQRIGNCNVDVVTDALRHSTQRITSPRYMWAGMGDGGACHPRDNIALSSLAKRLDLHYDLFGAIMGVREMQAFNLAELLDNLSRENNLPIIIVGRSYKPGIQFEDGSYSLLVADILRRRGVDAQAVNTPDAMTSTCPWVVLLAHPNLHIQAQVPTGSIVVDPWRQWHAPKDGSYQVVRYGDSR